MYSLFPQIGLHTFISLYWVLFFLALLLADVSYADEYSIIISTAKPTTPSRWQGTADAVRIDIAGNEGAIDDFQLVNPIGQNNDRFDVGTSNWYEVSKPNVGLICHVGLALGGTDGWHVLMVSVTNKNTTHGAVFVFDLALDDRASATRNIAVHGGWGPWSKWSVCKGSCGTDGTRFRVRLCDSPRPGCGGRECVGEKREKGVCPGKPCPTTATTYRTVRSDTHHDGSVTGTKCDNSSVVSVGVVLALSIVLNIILALFLFVVLRNMFLDSKDSRNQSNSVGHRVENSIMDSTFKKL